MACFWGAGTARVVQRVGHYGRRTSRPDLWSRRTRKALVPFGVSRMLEAAGPPALREPSPRQRDSCLGASRVNALPSSDLPSTLKG